LYEVENGVWKLNYKPKNKLPVIEYLKPQGRFKHLFTNENKHLIDNIQEDTDRKWEALLKKCGESI
jgi:pyruvate ferredoxin oxidoreductase beta subunit